MDLKKKFKTFISQQGLRSPSSPADNVSIEIGQQSSIIKEKIITEAELITQDPQVEAEILASIESIYCGDEDFDSGLYELKKIAEGNCDNGYIKAQKHLLWRQLQVVSKKVSDLILQNQSGYAVELQRVTELQTNLQEAFVICTTSRRHLMEAKEDFTAAGLGILSKYRKRQHLCGLLQAIHTIKTLQQTDMRLRELMDEENYPGAIQLCLACQKAAANFRHYKCITELSSKLQDTLVMIEEQLDVALSGVCGSFNSEHYSKLQTAYRLLGKTQTSMDQLHMHFTSAIHNRAFTIIHKYVKISSTSNDSNLQKRQYADLCALMQPENFAACLLGLCKTLWDIMHSYYCIMNWHETDNCDAAESSDQESTVETSLNRQYTKQKLEHGLIRIWQDIQHKVKLFLQAVDLSSFKFDEFICVLDVISRLMHIGEEFCNSKSEVLQESVRKQSINYFRNYHRSRIDELKIYLENEGWEPCPVKSNFSILKLTEFKFMTHHGFQAPSTSSSFGEEAKLNESYFIKYVKGGNPFDIESKKEDDDEDFYEDSKYSHDIGSESDDSDIADELKKDYVDERTGEQQQPTRRFSRGHSNIRKQAFQPIKSLPPILCNTTLNVLRLVGKYLQMMSLLAPISFDVVLCMSQLFEYYLYSVYKFFVQETENMSPHVNPIILRATVKRIQDNLILNESELFDGHNREYNRDKILAARLSPTVYLDSSKMFGLPERAVAVESVIYLAEQFVFLQQYLENSLPSNKKLFLQQFFSQTISSATEIRKPVFLSVPWQSIGYNRALSLMSEVQWDIGDIMSQHSPYVDALLQELAQFSQKLTEIAKETPIPKETYDVLWSHSIRMASHLFVEGFSYAKKCSNEGRALMQLDFQHFLTKLDKITELRPIPWKEHVEAYVKAFYLPETALDSWVAEHQEYSSKQLVLLVNCMSMTRRGRQRLINIIEENEKSRR